MTLNVISTDQTNTAAGGEIVNTIGTPNLLVGTGDEVIVLEGVTLAAGGSLVDVTALSDFDLVMNGDGFADSNAFRIDYQSSLGAWDFEVSVSIGNDATVSTNSNLSFFGVLATGSTYLQDGSEFRLNNAGTLTAMQGRGFEFQTIVTVQASNSGTVTVGEGPAFLFESVIDADFINTGTLISTKNHVSDSTLHTDAVVGFNAAVENVQFTNTGTITGNSLALVSSADVTENITNAGTIGGDVYTTADTAATSTFTNSGDILGTLDTRAGDDVVSNTGLITGGVVLGEDDDLFSNIGGGTVVGAIEGGDGLDTITGGSNADEIDGGADADRILGNGGEDTLLGDDGDDTMFGGSSDDELNGGNGVDVLFGNSGNDEINGGNDADVISGNSGEDVLNGGAGIDKLNGGKGNDDIIGGADRDNLFGGNGADVFDFNDVSDSINGATDAIRDFTRGVDVIDLVDTTGLNILFNDTSGFIGGGDASVYYNVNGKGQAIVRVDTDGDAVEDMRIQVNNIAELDLGDFAL